MAAADMEANFFALNTESTFYWGIGALEGRIFADSTGQGGIYAT